MATKKPRIESSRVYDRLVHERVREAPANSESVIQAHHIQERANKLIKNASDHYKKHYETFLNREIYKQVVAIANNSGDQIPALKKAQFEQAEIDARNALAFRYRMRLLNVEQTAQRMQLSVMSKEKPSPFSKAERIKERGATLKIALRRHFRRHYKEFVRNEMKRSSRGEFQTKQDRLLVLEKAQNKVLSRLNKRMKRVDRVTDQLHKRQLKHSQSTQKAQMRMSR